MTPITENHMTKCNGFLAFDTSGFVRRVKCGQWKCERCAKINAKLWAWRVRLMLGEGEWYMWTLTLGSKYKTAEQGFKDWPRLWNRLRMAVTRHYQRLNGKKWSWSYCAFVEGQNETRGGMPHFHIITNIKNPTIEVMKRNKKGERYKSKSSRIKDFAVKMGFGFEAYLKPVSDKKAAYYVAKYVSKGDPSMPKNFRRVRVSQDWQKLPEYEGDRLIIKSSKEHFSDYFLRVANETGTDIHDIYERYAMAAEWDDTEIVD